MHIGIRPHPLLAGSRARLCTCVYISHVLCMRASVHACIAAAAAVLIYIRARGVASLGTAKFTRCRCCCCCCSAEPNFVRLLFSRSHASLLLTSLLSSTTLPPLLQRSTLIGISRCCYYSTATGACVCICLRIYRGGGQEHTGNVCRRIF